MLCYLCMQLNFSSGREALFTASYGVFSTPYQPQADGIFWWVLFPCHAPPFLPASLIVAWLQFWTGECPVEAVLRLCHSPCLNSAFLVCISVKAMVSGVGIPRFCLNSLSGFNRCSQSSSSARRNRIFCIALFTPGECSLCTAR